MQLNDLQPGYRANRERKRRGRGTGSGTGTTGGRGTKGQNARKSGQVRPGFEGGQMPLLRRIPKRGFNNYNFALVFEIVNLGDIEERFSAGETVNVQTLKERGLANGGKDGIKILSDGDLTKALTFEVHKLSKAAEAKVTKAGGTINLLKLEGQKADKAAKKVAKRAGTYKKHDLKNKFKKDK